MGRSLHVRLDEATEGHLNALTKGKVGARSDAVREALASAVQAQSEKDFSPITERLQRITLANQETLLKLRSDLQDLTSEVTNLAKYQADRIDQVIAFIKESEKGFGRVSEEVRTVNQNALLAALYLMGLTSTHPRKDDIEAFVRHQGGA